MHWWAKSPKGENMFNCCNNNCRPNFIPVSFVTTPSVTGPAGPQGPTGPR